MHNERNLDSTDLKDNDRRGEQNNNETTDLVSHAGRGKTSCASRPTNTTERQAGDARGQVDVTGTTVPVLVRPDQSGLTFQ